MSNKIKGLIAAVLLALILFFAIRNQRIYVDGSFKKGYKRSMDSLNAVIKSKEDSIAISKRSEAAYAESVRLLQAQKDSLNDRIAEVKTENRQKVKDVDNFSSGALNDFFIQKYHAAICPPTDATLKLVVKDIVRGEGCETELSLTMGSLTLAEHQISLKDSIIGEKDKQIDLKSGIVTAHVAKEGKLQQNVDLLTERFKKLRRNDRIKMGVGTGIILGLGYGFIKTAAKK